MLDYISEKSKGILIKEIVLSISTFIKGVFF